MSVGKNDLGKWRSIEFECVFKSPEKITELVKLKKEWGLTDRITIKTDNSVEPNTKRRKVLFPVDRNTLTSTTRSYYDYTSDPQHMPREVVVSYVKGQEEVVRKVCKFLERNAYVNKSCGTHIHFDMRGKSKDIVDNMGKQLAKYVPALKSMLPKNRRNNSYCQGTISEFSSHGSRYSFINMTAYFKHKTIEVRGHHGTINADEILNWISICDSIMSKVAVEDKEAADQMIKEIGFDTELSKYIKQKQKEFNKKRPATPKKAKQNGEKKVVDTAG